MQWPLPQFPTQVLPPVAVTVNTGSPAGTKGAWATIVSGIPFEAAWISIGSHATTAETGTDTAISLDLAVGDSVVVQNLLFGHRWYHGTEFPLRLPVGATLRVRAAGAQANRQVPLYVGLYGSEADAGLAAPMLITTYGATASGGAGFTTSGSSNKNLWSWFEVTASTAQPIHALMVLVQGSGVYTGGAASCALDVGVGPSGSETAIIQDHRFYMNSDWDYVIPVSPEFHPLGMAIPAGARLAVRGGRVTGSGNLSFEVGLYGFTF